MNNSIMLCGPVPSPVGGVSIHLARLQHQLVQLGYHATFCDESPVFKNNIFNLRSFNIFKYTSLIRTSDLIHVHSGVGIFRLLHIIFGYLFRKPVVVTIHSWAHNKYSTLFWRTIFRFFSIKLIMVSERIREIFNLPCHVIPAFIRPNMELEPSLPIEIQNWFDFQKRQNRFIISSNAFRIDFHDGVDLYGLDFCVSAMSDKWVGDNCALFYVIANPKKSQRYIDDILSSIKDAGLDDRIFVYLGSVSFLKIMERSDATIRATNTDGDSLSVRESLWLKKITIASDAAIRPLGTVVFKSRDVSEFVHELKKSYISSKCHQPVFHKVAQTDMANEIISVYNKLLNK